jgi:pimeloyl-ACP methyl ester carboxylesterase
MNAPRMSARSRLRPGCSLPSSAWHCLADRSLRAAPAAETPAAEAVPASTTHHPAGAKPTIVVVPSALADACGWAGVVHRLPKRGYNVIAPANPLRGIDSDSAYVDSVLAAIRGSIVLVGHCYGGELITNAAHANPNVTALVYIAAFAPDQGETSACSPTWSPAASSPRRTWCSGPTPGRGHRPQSQALRPASGDLAWTVSVDSTITRVHQHAATPPRDIRRLPSITIRGGRATNASDNPLPSVTGAWRDVAECLASTARDGPAPCLTWSAVTWRRRHQVGAEEDADGDRGWAYPIVVQLLSRERPAVELTHRDVHVVGRYPLQMRLRQLYKSSKTAV